MAEAQQRVDPTDLSEVERLRLSAESDRFVIENLLSDVSFLTVALEALASKVAPDFDIQQVTGYVKTAVESSREYLDKSKF